MKYDGVVGFDDKIDIRLRRYEKLAVAQIVSDFPDLFSSPSHFCRCAVLSYIRDFKKDKVKDGIDELKDLEVIGYEKENFVKGLSCGWKERL